MGSGLDWVTVIHVGRRNPEGQIVASIVDDKVRLQAIEPPRGDFPTPGYGPIGCVSYGKPPVKWNI